MGLGEHELEGWEGPSKTEVATDVAVEVFKLTVSCCTLGYDAMMIFLSL